MSVEQLPLFTVGKELPLSAAISGFHQHMIRKGFTDNTISAFLNDLRILTRYLGDDHPLSQIGASDLKDFMTYLRYERGVPCKPKSYARRMTTLKVFFAWLAEEGTIPSDPAAPLIHQRASTPLPQFLYEGQVEKLLQATVDLMQAEKNDARPHLLVTLLLRTGIKKSECMAIRLNDIDTSEPKEPVLYIRYSNPKMKHKERKLRLSADFVPILHQYLAEYHYHLGNLKLAVQHLEFAYRDRETDYFSSAKIAARLNLIREELRDEKEREKPPGK